MGLPSRSGLVHVQLHAHKPGIFGAGEVPGYRNAPHASARGMTLDVYRSIQV
jgi:hypothetical protein